MLKIFKTISDAKLNPNQFYVLYCIKNNIEAQFINIHLELRALKLLDYIDKANKITPKGEMLLTALSSIDPVKTKTEVTIGQDFIDAYLELWPRIKLPTGKYARCDKKTITDAFKWFFTTYPYDIDTVLKATAMYIDEYERKQWNYMRTSLYFIKKTDVSKQITSDLAIYCDQIKAGLTGDDTHIFEEKVF